MIPSWVLSHYNDIIMGTIASQITCLTIVFSTVYLDTDHHTENIKAPRHWPLCVEFTGDRWLHAQMASNAENVSIWWRHHVRGTFTMDVYLPINLPILKNISTNVLAFYIVPDRWYCADFWNPSSWKRTRDQLSNLLNTMAVSHGDARDQGISRHAIFLFPWGLFC